MTTSHEDQASTNGTSSASTDEKPDIDQLQAEIEQTRAELGETVEALTAKLDVKSRTKDRLNQYKTHATGQVKQYRSTAGGHLTTVRTRATDFGTTARSAATTEDGKPTPTAMATAAAVLVSSLTAVGLTLWRRRR
jgi:hypothetical protein